jgi:hypothetical protein
MSYTPIDSLPVTVANQTYFSAIGCSTIEITLPNREEMTQMIFQNILHCPEVAFMLISTTVMDQIGYRIEQKDCKLTIHTLQGGQIAVVPQVDRLYCVSMPAHVAAITAGRELTVQLDELYQCLGHIGIEACCDAV